MLRYLLLSVILAIMGISCCHAADTPAKPAPPELMLWLRADALAKTLDDGGEVKVWPDDSGRGNDAVADQGMEPSFSLKGVDGTPAVHFAGNANAKPKIIQRLTLPLTGEWRGATIFCVGANLQQGNWLGTMPGAQGELRMIGSIQHCNAPTSPSCPLGVKSADGLQLVTLADGLTPDGLLQCDIYADGKRVSGFSDDKSVFGLMWGKAHLGAYFDWAALNGEIDEFIVYRGLLSEANRTAVEHYLRAKYKLAGAKDDDPTAPAGYPLPAPPALPTASKVTKQPVEDHLQLWLRADDLTLKDGERISEAPNNAGDKQPLTAEDAHRPLFIADAMNHRPVIRFAGDKHAKPPISHKLTVKMKGHWPEMTLIMVGQGLNHGGLFGTNQGTAAEVRMIGAIQHCGSSLVAGAPMLDKFGTGQLLTLTVRFDDAGGMMTSYANGIQQESHVAAKDAVRFPYVEFGNMVWGEYFDPFHGDLAEVMFYDRVLTDNERKSTEGYLAEKWGLVLPTKEEAEAARSSWSFSYPHLSAEQNWACNSFSGKYDWVSSGIFDTCLLPDGTLVTCSVWDEAHKEIGWYKDGHALGGYSGGASALTSDGRFLYIGVSGMGQKHSGVKRWALKKDDPLAAKSEPPLPILNVAVAQWPHPFAADASWPEKKPGEPIWFETTEPWQEIIGMAVHGGELYLTQAGKKEISVLDAGTGVVKRTIPVEAQPGRLACAPDGTLWAIVGAEVCQFAADGKASGKRIMGLTPGGVACDCTGHVYVSDNGVRQQVVIFDVAGAQPKETGALGERGGVYTAAQRGEISANRLLNPSDVEVDAAGNATVLGPTAFIRNYAPDGKLRWQLEGTSFCTVGDFDPATDGKVLYTGQFAYTCTGVKSGAKNDGSEWRLTGWTTDAHRYDDKLAGYSQHIFLRRLHGKLFRFTLGNDFRIEEQEANSITFAPRGIYCMDERTSFWRPTEAPKAWRYLWSDRNGDGKVEAEEISLPKEGAKNKTQSFDVFVDDNGDIWEPSDRWGFRHIPVKFTADGIPTWDLKDEIEVRRPGEFLDIQRVCYYPTTDTMYLAGGTWEHPSTGIWGFGHCGREVIRYDDWSKPTRHIRSRMVYPAGSDNMRALTIAPEANRLFVGSMGDAVIFAYDTVTGKLLGILEPDARLFGPAGAWFDQSGALRSFRCKNGDILLGAEEGLCAKMLIYRIPAGKGQ